MVVPLLCSYAESARHMPAAKGYVKISSGWRRVLGLTRMVWFPASLFVLTFVQFLILDGCVPCGPTRNSGLHGPIVWRNLRLNESLCPVQHVGSSFAVFGVASFGRRLTARQQQLRRRVAVPVNAVGVSAHEGEVCFNAAVIFAHRRKRRYSK